MLVADTGGPTGGLAACAGVADAASLPEAARAARRGSRSPAGSWAADPHRRRDRELRVIATAPAPARQPATRRGSRALLDDRCAATPRHALVVVDCGTLQRGADRLALRGASHVAWVLPATGAASTRAARVLDALPPRPARAS